MAPVESVLDIKEIEHNLINTNGKKNPLRKWVLERTIEYEIISNPIPEDSVKAYTYVHLGYLLSTNQVF